MKKWMIKLLPVLLALVLVLGSCLTVSAADLTEDYAGMNSGEWHEFIQSIEKDYSPIIDKQPFYLASVAGNGVYHILYSSKVFKYSDGFIYSSPQESGERGVEVQFVSYDSNTDSVSFINSYYLGPSWQFTNVSSDVFISNHNITYLGLSDVFFHLTPSGYLYPVLQKIQLKEMTLQEVVSLLPLLMLFLTSVIGFWKALQLLSRILRKA